MSPKAISEQAYANLTRRASGGGPNAYQQGKRLEYKCQDELRALGFVTMRSAGSKGAVDIMAVREGELLFVQVKRTTAPGPAAWNLLFDMATWCGAKAILATCQPYKPIRYERIVFRKPLPRSRNPGVDSSGVVPYVLSPSAVLEEPETESENDSEGEELW